MGFILYFALSQFTELQFEERKKETSRNFGNVIFQVNNGIFVFCLFYLV